MKKLFSFLFFNQYESVSKNEQKTSGNFVALVLFSADTCMMVVYPCPFPSLLEMFFPLSSFFLTIFQTANVISFNAGKKIWNIQSP